MKKQMKKLFMLSLAAAVLFVAAGVAKADRTITLLTSGSVVTSMTFDLQTANQVVANVCGRAPLQGGGFSSVSCHSITLTSGSVYTSVQTLATGAALTFWLGREGI